MADLYGIANCDTVKTARRWLQEHGVEYAFHDFKKEGLDKEKLDGWCDALGWETLLNRRGTTWRKLPDNEKAELDRIKAIDLMLRHSSLIKRPVLECHGNVYCGFSDALYAEVLLS